MSPCHFTWLINHKLEAGLKKNLKCWLAGRGFDSFLAAVHRVASVLPVLLFISPFLSTLVVCGCVCGCKCGVVLTKIIRLPSNSGYFWLRPSHAIYQCRPCPRPSGVPGQLASCSSGAPAFSSHILAPPKRAPRALRASRQVCYFITCTAMCVPLSCLSVLPFAYANRVRSPTAARRQIRLSCPWPCRILYTVVSDVSTGHVRVCLPLQKTTDDISVVCANHRVTAFHNLWFYELHN